MKRMVLVALFSICFVFLASLESVNAEQKYNPFSGEWETVEPSSELHYNPFSGVHEYAPPGSSPQSYLITINLKISFLPTIKYCQG